MKVLDNVQEKGFLSKEVIETIKIPVFPIGGISLNNVGQLKKLGVRRLAVCRDILLAKDAGKVVKKYKQILSVRGC